VDHSAFIVEQIAKTGRPYITKPDHVLVQCPIHAGGQERTPSRKINISNPRFKPYESFCYACHDEQKRLSWNELAAVMHMAPIRVADGEEVGGEDDLWIKMPTPEEFYGSSEVTGIGHMPWTGPWKRDGVTISEKFLRKMGATLVDSRDEPRLYLPVMVDEVEIGNVQCVIDKTDESSKIKYLLSNNPKFSNYTLYPVDEAFPLAERLGYIVLVEGARDALNLLQHGVPAVCIWGTNGWTRAKRDIIIELGVRVILAMDGDEPGQHANSAIAADLKRVNVPHKVITFAEDMDPGKMKRADVIELRDMLSKKWTPQSLKDNRIIKELLAMFNRVRRHG
jgi:5S rRNA maturation endonuclease (ribonuclease M5)